MVNKKKIYIVLYQCIKLKKKKKTIDSWLYTALPAL